MKLVMAGDDCSGSPRIFQLGEKNLLGRGKQCDIHLSGDEKASRTHAAIVRHVNTFWIKDLDSNNGTFVNGERITGPVHLCKDDEITIGSSVFTVQSDLLAKPALDKDEDETVFAGAVQPRGTSAAGESDDETQFISPEALEALYADAYTKLYVIRGPREGEAFVLRKMEMTIGRSLNNDIQFSCSSISGRHAAIRRNDDTYSIVDLGSKNGTFVNRQRLTGERSLQAGDIILLGEVSLRFGEETAQDNAPAPEITDGGKKKISTMALAGLLLGAGLLILLLQFFSLRQAPPQVPQSPARQEAPPEPLAERTATNLPPEQTQTPGPSQQTAVRQIEPSPQPPQREPSLEERREKGIAFITEAKQLYVAGDVEAALRSLQQIMGLALNAEDPILRQGQAVFEAIKASYASYSQGHKSYLRGDINASVAQWDKVHQIETTFLDSSLGQSNFSQNIRRFMAEELSQKAVRLVEKGNKMLARQYCIEVLKAIPDHKGCTAIMQGAEK